MSQTAGNALLSVYDKAGIDVFAQELEKLGWKIYASGGTAEAIKKAGVKVTDTSEIIGGGQILGHRVVTLSREIYAGLLADNSDEHQKELESLDIPRIDLVAVDMYPLSEEIAKPNSSEKDVIEKTDVGGPTLLHAAAKGRRIVLSRPSQRKEVIDWLKNGKPDEDEFVHNLVKVAEMEVADYMIESAKYLGRGNVSGLISERIEAPSYGENPWQLGAGFYASDKDPDPLGISKFKLIEGIPLSYNNYTDIDRMLQTITHTAAVFEKNYMQVPNIALGAKHGNVCGASFGENKVEVLQKMLDGDLRAIFGGTVMTNFVIDKQLAEVILHYKMEDKKRILDIVIAPEISEEAAQILNRKSGKLRLFVNPELGKLGEKSIDQTKRVRHVRGGRLRQNNYTLIVDCEDEDIQKAGPEPTPEQIKDMIFAWAIGSTSNSNTICITRNGQLLSNGVGQQDRVTAAELCLMRANNAGHNVDNSTAYSDSFFPFPDGLELLINAGVTSVFTTRGSVNDKKVEQKAVDSGISFCTLPDKKARGFFGH